MEPPIHPEELLLTWAKWPILGVQFNGYLSLSVTQNKFTKDTQSQPKNYRKSLQFHFVSIPFIFHVLFITIFSVLIICFGNKGYNAFKRLEELSSDATILAGYTLCGFIYTIGNRTWSLFSVKKSLVFWAYQVDKISLITPNLWDPESVRDLRKEIRTSFLRTVFFISIVMISLFLGDLILVDFLKISKYSVIADSFMGQSGPVVIAGLFWTYCYFSNAFLSVWLSFFVKIYAAAVSSIRAEVKLGKITGTKIARISKAYSILIKLVNHFNAKMGRRIFLEVGFNLIFILGSTYFVIVSVKVGEIGNMLTNLTSAVLSMHVLYIYGNDGEKLEAARVQLVTLLCELEGNWEMGVADKQIRDFQMKVKTCKLRITPENYFKLDRSFILSVLPILMTLLIVLAQFRDSDEKGGTR
ncbi:uncharacterized protein LOC118435961 isoform X1 [Folsomia candida]|nr:uncharacterized protein LOC118435537 isoform X1 [Folsomia candida]XP_035707609.1 uncharacterized protein LOC118435537 isoform X1 [Folsomia candida]XP_035707615.1 uncharacterized protein LOC118435539 [Folsomia candida]XP_035708423.1 uncharacterized protein LOC118435961 isoform X1 [Folsomia candida]